MGNKDTQDRDQAGDGLPRASTASALGRSPGTSRTRSHQWQRGLPALDLPPPNGRVIRLRRAIRRRCAYMAFTAVGSLLLALALTFEVLLIQTPGDADTARALWVGTMLLGVQVGGLEPFAASWSVAAVAATFLVAFAVGHSPLSQKDDNDTARAVVMDHLLTTSALAGAVISWMLVQLPTQEDPRALNAIGPVLAALLCLALGAMSDQSAGSREYGRLRDSEARRNLKRAVDSYAASLGRVPAEPRAKTPLDASVRFLLPTALVVSLLWAAMALSLVTARGNLDVPRTIAVLGLALIGFILCFFWIVTSADSQVNRVATGRGGWGVAPFPFWMVLVLFTGTGVALALVEWRIGLLSATLGMLPLVSWGIQVALPQPRIRYLRCVHDKLARRLATLSSRSDDQERRSVSFVRRSRRWPAEPSNRARQRRLQMRRP